MIILFGELLEEQCNSSNHKIRDQFATKMPPVRFEFFFNFVKNKYMRKRVNSKKIKALRDKRGWTQEDLAKFSEINLSTIKRMETKNQNFNFHSIKEVANAFEIDFNELIDYQTTETVTHDIELIKLEHGKEIDDLLFGKTGAEFVYDNSIKNEKSIHFIHNLFKGLDLHIENQQFGSQRLLPDHICVLNRVIEKLGSEGLYIFGGETRFTKKYEDEIFDIEVAKIWIGREVIIPITKDGLSNSFFTTISQN